ncbi:hypothetical protein [Paenibacillus sp. J2TS4]|uniref:hypothetical protein n=1 Tax=Paenibacillus sp. J2TS4 TaxID=2807194 RepID=UPI001B1166AF|nr:hypothetical protein [Paenibacillus sp. J2TS4]GIP31897.1 hypothetical protein J2TS4_11070 [Paenibacillus sp. J2TS4]
MMKALAVQACVEVRREIQGTEEMITEIYYDMKLFENEIQVRNERIPLKSVFDISYFIKDREKDVIGFLYLHTKSGVQTYYVKEKPIKLIEIYKKLIADR